LNFLWRKFSVIIKAFMLYVIVFYECLPILFNTFMKVDIEKIADFDLEEQQWGVIDRDNDPRVVEL